MKISFLYLKYEMMAIIVSIGMNPEMNKDTVKSKPNKIGMPNIAHTAIFPFTQMRYVDNHLDGIIHSPVFFRYEISTFSCLTYANISE